MHAASRRIANNVVVEKKRIALEQLGAIEKQFATFRDRFVFVMSLAIISLTPWQTL